MVEVEAATEIPAPARAVWSVLTDFAHYDAWNPFIHHARGTAHAGDDVHVRVRSSFGLPLAFRATVLEADENRELHWVGHVLAPWLARGEHWFTIQPVDDKRVRFVQRERFTGLVPWLARKLLARESRQGFDAMNTALARRAADQAAASAT